MTALNARGEEITPDEGPSGFDIGAAAFERINLFGPAVTRLGLSPDTFWRQLQRPDEVRAMEEGFDGIAQTIGTAWEPYLRRLGVTRSQEEYSLEQQLILREINQDQVMSQGGSAAVASILTFGLLDPLMFVPSAAGSKGLSIAKRFAIGGAIVGVAQETLLQSIDPDRTLTQSAIAVGTISLVSGILGKGVSLTRGRKHMQKMADDLDAEIRAPDVELEPPPNTSTVEGSGAVVRAEDGTILEKSYNHKEWKADKAGKDAPEGGLETVGFGVERVLAKATRWGQTTISPSAATRETSEGLFTGSAHLQGTGSGRVTAQAAETEIDRTTEVGLGRMFQARDSLYYKYRTGEAGGGRRDVIMQRAHDVAASGRGALNELRGIRLGDMGLDDLGRVVRNVGKPQGGALSLRQFDDEVFIAFSNNGQHEIKEVAEMAQWMTKNFYDPAYQRALKSGVVSRATNALNRSGAYLHRRYLLDKIREQPEKWRELFEESLTRDVKSKAAEAAAKGDVFEELTEKQIKEISENVTDHMINAPLGRSMTGTLGEMDATLRGAMKDRTLDFITDKDLLGHNGGWLDTNLDENARSYMRTVVPDTILMERFGSVGLTDQIKDIKKDWGTRIQNRFTDNPQRKGESAEAYKTRMGRYSTEMSAARKKDLANIEMGIAMLRGTFQASANPQDPIVRTVRAMRNFNILTKGGGFLISSFADIARPTMVHGVRQAFGTAFTLLRNGMEGIHLSAEDARIAGVGFELSTQTRGKTLAEMGELYAKGNRLERGIQGLTNNFFLLNGLGPWNHAMKQWSSSVVSSKMLNAADDIFRTGKTSAANMRTLNHLGIDNAMAIRIAGQYKKHGAKIDKVKIAQMSKWDDDGAIAAFANAVKKDVDNVIVTPGVTDTPSWMTKELGKTLGQFKSFAFASTNSVLLSSLQQRDKSTLQGLGIALFMGAGVYTMKQKLNGRPLGEPNDYIWNSVDRSGVLGIVADVHNTWEKITGAGIPALVGAEGAQRYGQFGVAGAVGGPTLGLADDFFTAVKAPFTVGERSGRISDAEARSTLRLMPYRNLFYFQHLTNKAAEAYAR